MNLNHFFRLFVWIVSLCVVQTTHAAVINITANTNWSAITGGTGAGGKPSLSDDVNVTSGAVLTINTTAVCNNLTLNDGIINVGGFNVTIAGELYLVNGAANWQSTSGSKTIHDVTIDPMGEWVDIAPEAFNITGDFVSTGGFTPGEGIYTFSGTGATINTAFGTVFNKMSVTGIVTNLGTLIVEDLLSGSGTFVNGVTGEISLKTNITISSLDGSAIGNRINYTGNGSQTVKSATYYKLSIENAGTRTLGGPITVNGDLIISGGTLSCGVHQITGNASGLMQMAAGTTLNLGLTTNATEVLFPTNFTSVNITLDPASTVVYQSNGNQTLSIAPGSYGNLTVKAGSATCTKTYSKPTLQIDGTLSLGGANMTFDLASTDVTVAGNITGSNGKLSFVSGNLSVAGNYTHTGTLTAGTGTVTYNGTNQTVKGATYNNLTLTNSGIKTLGNATTVGSDLQIDNGVTLNSTTRNLTVNGFTVIDGTYTDDNTTGVNTFGNLVTINGNFNYTVNEDATFKGGITCNGTMNSNTGFFTFSTSNQTIQGTNPLVIDAYVTISSGVQLTNNGTLTLNGTCNGSNPTATLINGVGANLNVGADLMNINGALAASAMNNTVHYNSSNPQTLVSTTYHHLSKSGAGDATLKGCPVNGDLNINAGSLTITQTNLTGTASGLLTVANGAELRLGSPSASNAIVFPTGFVFANINLAAGSVVTYQTNGNQTISTVPDYANLSIATGGTNADKTFTGTLTVNEDLTITNGSGTCTLLMNAETINLAGNTEGDGDITCTSGDFNIAGSWNNTGTFTAGTGTVDYNGGSAQTIGALDYFNLTSSSTGGRTLPSGQTVSISNLFTPGGNTYTITNSTVRFNGTSAQTMGAFDFHHLMVDNAAGLSITGTQTLAGVLTLVQGNFDTNGQSFTMLASSGSAASIAAIPSGSSVVGNVTIQQFAPAGVTGYALIGTPIEGAQIVNWQDDFPTSGFTGATGSAGGFVSINGYDETQTGAFVNGFTNPTNATNPVPVGDAFWVYLGTASPNTPDITIDLTGTVHQGDFDFSPSYTFSATPDADGWNLIGNPYPSAIDWDAAGWTRTNMEDAVYLWNTDLSGGAGNYATYINGVGTNGGSNFIAHSQGFYVLANAASPQLECTEAVKAPNAPTFLRTTQVVAEGLRFSLKNADGIKLDETVIRFDESATNGFDSKYDARKPHLPAMIPTAELYTLSGELTLSVNTMKAFTGSTTIPVGIKVKDAGRYLFDFSDLNGLIQSANSSLQQAKVVLIDKKVGTQTQLLNGSMYKFTADAGTVNDRFEIRIAVNEGDEALTANHTLQLFSDQGNFFLSGSAIDGLCSYQVFSTSGQLLSEKTMNMAKGTLIELNTLPVEAGVYLIRFTSLTGGTKSFRVIR